MCGKTATNWTTGAAAHPLGSSSSNSSNIPATATAQQQLERELRQQQQRQQSRQAFYRAVLYQVLIRHPSPSTSTSPFLRCALVQWRLLQFLVQLILSEVSHCCRAKPQFCVACGECGECVQWRPLLSPAVQLKHSTAAAFSLSLSLFVCVCVPQEVKSIAAA